MTRDLKNIGPSEFTVKSAANKAPSAGVDRTPATLIAAVCVLVLVGGILYGAVRILPGIGKKIGDSSYFRLEDVDVIGVERANRDDIGNAIGFAAGSPLLETDLAAIRERVAAIDWVKAVEVSRTLPNRLVITITEHTPVATTTTDEGRRYVDPDGELARIDGNVGTLPTFVGMTGPEHFAEGALLLDLIAKKGLVADGYVRTVKFDTVMGYTVITAQGIEIQFGPPPFEGKIARLTRVLEDAQKRGRVQYIYLNIENRVVVKVGASVM